MAKKLNKKVAIIGIVILSLFVVGAAGLAYRHFYHRNPERNLALAREAVAEGDIETATRYLGRAYAHGKTDAWKIERLFELAEVHLTHTDDHEPNWPMALRSWNTVLNINPKHVPARRRMMEYYYEMADSGTAGAWRNVYDNTKELVDIGEQQDAEIDTALLNAHGRAAMAIAARGGTVERDRYLTESIESFETLIERQPAVVSHYSHLANAYLIQGELNAQAGHLNARDNARRKAYETLDQAVENADNRAEALAARYRVKLQEVGNDSEQVEAIRAELEQQAQTLPPDAELFRVLSQAYELPGKGNADAELNRAIETAQRAVQLAPEDFESGYRLVRLMYRKGSAFADAAAMADALAIAEEMLTLPQTQDVPGPRQARHQYNRNAVHQFLAQYYLENALESPETAKKWVDQAAPVVHQIEQYYGSSEHPVVQQWQGILALTGGRRNQGVRQMLQAYEQGKALDVADQLSGINPVLCVVLAQVAREDGQFGLQREYLEKALHNRNRIVMDKPSLILDYAELLGSFGAWNHTLQYVNSYQQRYGANARSQRLIIDAALALGETEQVAETVKTLSEGSDERKVIEFRLAVAQTAQLTRDVVQLQNAGQTAPPDMIDELRGLLSRQDALLRDLIDSAPEKVDSQWVRSVSVHFLRNDDVEKAVTLLDAYLASAPDDVALRLLRRQAQEPDPLAVPQDRLLAIQAEAIEQLDDPKQKAMIQAGVLRAQGLYDKALEALDRAAKAAPDDDKDVLEERFQIALERQDIAAAEAMLPTLRSRNLDGCEGGLAAAQVELLKKNYPLALRRVEECLTLRPMMSFGHYLKSRIHHESGEVNAAVQSARRAIQMSPLNSLYAKNFASVLFERNTALGGRATREEQNELVQALTMAIHLNPTDWQLQSVYAETIGEETPDRALAIRRQLFDSYPNAANAVMLGNMALRMARDERDAAKKTGLIDLSGKAFMQALEMEPENEMIRAAYADYLRQTEQSQKAEELLRDDKNLLWRFYLQSGQFDKAKAQLEQLHGENPQDTTVLRGLILTAENMGNRADRKTWLDRLAETAERKEDELWLVEKYIDAGYIEEADRKLASVRERHPDERLILLLDAWSKMAKGQLQEGLSLVNRYLESDRDNSAAWRLRGRLYRLMNEPRRAIDDLQRSRALDSAPAISMELANVYREIGQIDAAVGELIAGLQNPQAPLQMRLMLESLYQQHNRVSDLERFYSQTLERYPESAFWHKQVGQYYLSQDQPAKAVPYLKTAWELVEKQRSADASILNAYLKAMIENRQYNDAFTAASALIDGPLAPLAYARMAESQFKLGQRQRAEELFFTALDKGGAVDAFQEITLSLMLDTVGQDAAVRWTEKNPNTVPSLLLGYRIAQRNERFNRAIDLIDRCLAAVGDGTPEWVGFSVKKSNLLVQAYTKTADAGYLTRAIDLFGQILQRYPGNPTLLNNMAYLLATNDQQLEQALGYARRAHQSDPGNPTYLDTYAFTQYKNEHYQQAHENLLRAIQLFEVQQAAVPWDVYNHLGMTQEALGQTEQAIDSFQRALGAAAAAPEKERNALEQRITALKQQANT